MKAILFYSLLFNSFFLGSQIIIEGVILDDVFQSAVGYAEVKVFSNGKKTLSNEEGYFKIEVNSYSDILEVKQFSYLTQKVKLTENGNYYTILLREKSTDIDEVIIQAKENEYFYDLLSSMRQAKQSEEIHSKAYFSLSSFRENEQIEYLEAYYNANSTNYGIKNFQLKAGRLGVKVKNSLAFVSISTSEVFLKFNFREEQDWFPLNPMALSRKKMQTNFRLELTKKFTNDSGDSIYCIHFSPKYKNKTESFIGDFYINKSKNSIEKAVFKASVKDRQPFVPISGNLASVDLNLSLFFAENEQNQLEHIDFDYLVKYEPRSTSGELYELKVKTKAVMHLYDTQTAFNLPFYDFNYSNISDYRRINSYPYNDFFWKTCTDFRMFDSIDRSASFLEDPFVMTNHLKESHHFQMDNQFIESANHFWSQDKRFIFDLTPEEKVRKKASTGPNIPIDKYNLSIKLFLDINQTKDSNNIVSATIFDVFNSFYYFDIDKNTLCFMNILFDLYEIERRHLEQVIRKSDFSPETIEHHYMVSLNKLESLKRNYFLQCERGKNIKNMAKYNAIVLNELNIDNMTLFQVESK